MTHVRRWMTCEPRTVLAEASALEALELMIEGGFRHLPVLSRDGALVGIVSIDDLQAALPFRVALQSPPSTEDRRQALEFPVGELMTYAPFVVQPDTSVAEAAGELARRRIGCLPVLENGGKLVGIFSESDALRALASELPSAHATSERLPELEHLARELHGERLRMLQQLRRSEAVERELSSQERDQPMDFSDHASRLSTEEFEGALADFAARRLAEIDRALDRHARGELGTCMDCGQRISLGRLRARPGAGRCARCEASHERSR